MTGKDITSIFQQLDRIEQRLINLENASLVWRKATDKTLQRLERAVTPAKPARFLKFFEIMPGGAIRRMEKMEVVKGKAKKKIKITFEDADGNPAEVDGAPRWSSTAEDVATVVADADGMGSKVAFSGKAGTGKIQVFADADMTPDGMEEIIGEWEFQVVGGKATIIKLNVSDDTDADPVPADPVV